MYETEPDDDAAAWDERYSSQDEMWSGRPNGVLVAEVEGIELRGTPPGRAFEVGCGEGADAIWLASRGWKVTALDPSAVAVDRAQDAAARRGAEIDWVVSSVVEAPPEPAAFDLVVALYPALRIALRDAAIRAMTAGVARGGTLLVVHHSHDEHTDHEDHGFDPGDYVKVADVAASLGGDWDVEVHEVRPRADPPPGAHHVLDEVLRARRRS